ncbi:GNAT family N-acetyltransferase [Paenibacillus sp. JCM 10914]|uniref:GNAT family N-acetyltransferase n=1 Tax=Paenibacillus sp. JCM 10914 TaxID=1236974 RepID=UPI001E29E220|nr:GNAT family N-acetyltransferase [Paenibacillus sp. JCM 10914]
MQRMHVDHVQQLSEIDRSEYIEFIYIMKNGHLERVDQNHECPNWDSDLLAELQQRYVDELKQGGVAVGAYDGERLVGFGVLSSKRRGVEQNRVQVDLMYVTRHYRKQGIGTRIMDQLAQEAKAWGAKYLYISSTETQSAVSFYQKNGGSITTDVDPELFEKEPMDIHMIKEL